MKLLPSELFWTGVLSIPRVKSDMLEIVMLHELGKAFPGSVSGVAGLRWECLDGLWAPGADGKSNYLVQIPLEAQDSGLSRLQAFLRFASRPSGEKPAALVAASAHGLEVLLRDGQGQVHYQLVSPAELSAVLQEAGEGSLVFLPGDPILVLPPQDRAIRTVEEIALLDPRLHKAPLRNDSRRAALFRRRLLAAGIAACLVVALAWVWRVYDDRQSQVQALRGQVLALQRQMQLDASGNQERSALAQEVAALEKRLPVDLYRLLQGAVERLGPQDRILMVRWDAASRTLNLELASRQAIALLDRLSQSGLFASLTSGGMSPLAEDGSYMRFTMTGLLEAP